MTKKIYKRDETTEINLALGIPGMYSAFTPHITTILRALAITVGVASILCSICNIYMMENIHPSKKFFRHQILLTLFTSDMIKCLLYTAFSIAAISSVKIYSSPIAYNILGYFTHLFLVASDSLIFFLSWHFAILIFKPDWRWFDGKKKIYKGGIYGYRYVIYIFTAVYSLSTASLVFLNYNKAELLDKDKQLTISTTKGLGKVTRGSKLGGYKPYVTIIALPVHPFYYSLFFSWLFRYIVMISIFTIFISIYVKHVTQLKTLKKRFNNLNSNSSNDSQKNHSPNNESLNFQINDIRQEFNEILLEEFQKTQQKFKKHLLLLFLYPVCYFFLWIMPLVENIEQPFHDRQYGPIIPLTFLVTLCHPANGLFDTIVFQTIEKPLQNSWYNIECDILKIKYMNNKNRDSLSFKDKLNLCYNTKWGLQGWYYSKEVSDSLLFEKDTEKLYGVSYKKIKWYWKLYHHLPMQKSIDLDLLNYKSIDKKFFMNSDKKQINGIITSKSEDEINTQSLSVDSNKMDKEKSFSDLKNLITYYEKQNKKLDIKSSFHPVNTENTIFYNKKNEISNDWINNLLQKNSSSISKDNEKTPSSHIINDNNFDLELQIHEYVSIISNDEDVYDNNNNNNKPDTIDTMEESLNINKFLNNQELNKTTHDIEL